MTNLLAKINATNDIKKLAPEELPALASEIRNLILDVVGKTGGHLGSNLGVIELTLALHYAFDVTKDVIVWDGSYQTYTHKILTGRKDKFPTLRQFGGMCGFGWKPESETDPFNFGHVGTGPGAALGVAMADEQLGRKRKVISVIGDGSMTAGVALEAINNIGTSGKPLLMILNDNGMSIAKTVGSLSLYFNELRSAPLFQEFKHEVHRLLGKLPFGAGQTAEHVLDALRRGLTQTIFPNLFTGLGMQYYGPIDGHDIKGLLAILQNVRSNDKPVVLHLVTQKGLGHPDAKCDPFAMHKAGTAAADYKLEPATASAPAAPKAKSYTTAFIDSMCDLAAKDKRIMGLTAAMPDGTGIMDFGKKFPDRMFDVGISEQVGVAMAAGMAQGGLRPVVAIYSSFMQRAYDIIFQEMCLNNLPVVLVLDRAGIAGEDGPTHHGNFDIAYLRTFPNMVLMAPKDEREVREMLTLALSLKQPSAIRLPRENVPDLSRFKLQNNPVALGKGELLAKGRHGAILAYGVMVDKALAAREVLLKEGIDVAVANARFAKPIDSDLAAFLAKEYPWVLTLEDHATMGGFGSAVLEALSLRNEDTSKLKIHAIPDRFLQHADRKELLKFLHLDPEGICDVVRMIAGGQALPELDPTQRKHFLYGTGEGA
ncbi:MAG TPA: 1-deoxy-D-xylulose-5-phosphate synthase [Planctomycetota bacterium]|nr:1-deoxy-D-xylulose-5-phosphate synthase [Planctomycetota bacterium]